MIFLGLLISFFLGNVILRSVSRQNSGSYWELNFALSLSIGLAASGLLTFLSLLIFGEFNRTFIILINLAAVLLLAVSGPRQAIVLSTKNASLKEYTFNFLNIFLWLTLFMVVSELSLSHPYGQWDAWALWNMKTKFIIFGGKSWQNIFQLHWHTQPDYPLLLPMINSWLTAVSGAELHRIAMMTANVFTISTGFLLFAALQRTMPVLCALGVGFILATNRFYLFMGTSQYADIVLAHYLLAAGILTVYGLKEKNPALIFLAGLSLGILGFIKNEGITIALILLAILLFTLRTNKTYHAFKQLLTKKLLLGFAAAAWAPLIFKIFLAPSNRDISFEALKMLPQLISLQRISLILEYFARSISDNYWQYIWIFILVIVLLNFSRFRRAELKVFILFFAVYFLAVGIIYLATMNFDLLWRLTRTAPRVLFCLMPLAFFLSLTAAWPQDDDPLDAEKNKGIMSGS